MDRSQAPFVTRSVTPESLTPALGRAQDLGHPVYDCVYFGLAVTENCRVVTADGRFADIVGAQPSLAGTLILMDEVS